MLSVQSLSCRRGNRPVFRALNWQARPGDFVLVTGPNGSGKSSLLRILAGLLPPSSGSVVWEGNDICSEPSTHRERVHYIGHLDAVKAELKVYELIAYWAALYRTRTVDTAQALEPFGLASLADRTIRSLSAGQKRRLSLSRLCLSPAKLWLLDEPLTALDGSAQKRLTDLLSLHRAQGGVLVAAMHDTPPLTPTLCVDMG